MRRSGKKGRQYNEKGRQYNGYEQKDEQCLTKHYTEK